MTTRRRKKQRPEEIAAKLRDSEARLNAGKDLAAVLPYSASLVRVELGRTEDGRVTAYVGELGGHGPRNVELSHGFFEQAGDDDWKFVAVESAMEARQRRSQ